MTQHIDRYEQMDDKTFLEHAKFYRKFTDVSPSDHLLNINYLYQRCDKLHHVFSEGCCNKFYLTKKEI